MKVSSLCDAILDVCLGDFSVRVGVMDVKSGEAYVLRATGLRREKIDYPEHVEAGQVVIVREHKDW
ncbi:MAG: hypothetical protein WAV41_04015 [Microgenomates group bacterium]